MSSVLEKLLTLLKEGSYVVMVPLVTLCLVLCVMILERGLFLFGIAWFAPLPRMRDRYRAAIWRLEESFEEFLTHPAESTRRSLLAACDAVPIPLSRFFVRVLGGPGLVPPALRDLQMQEASLAESIEIEKGLGIISTLAKVAPLLGLLGTVMGMIRTFSAMMVSSTGDPKALSSGISMALIATEVGLIVALPGVLAMTWLSRRAEHQQAEIRLAAMRLSQLRDADSKEVAP